MYTFVTHAAITTDHFHHPERSLMRFPTQSACLSPPGNQCTDLCHCKLVLSVIEFYINVFILFYVWLFPLGNVLQAHSYCYMLVILFIAKQHSLCQIYHKVFILW